MLAFIKLVALAAAASAYVVVDPNNIPAHTEDGMYGTNQCGTKDSASSKCQTAWVNGPTDVSFKLTRVQSIGVDDDTPSTQFCFFSGPKKEPVGDFERYAVVWCTAPHHGARLVPKGTFKNIQYVLVGSALSDEPANANYSERSRETSEYIQITATGDFSKVNVPKLDDGGELDPSGADGLGNPIGGIFIGKAYGKLEQFDRWTEFIAGYEFGLRVCRKGPNSRRNCGHIYDVMGAEWNIPGNYGGSKFESCKGNPIKYPMGVYPVSGSSSLSTFHQGDSFTPAGQNPAPTSECKKFAAPSPKYDAKMATAKKSSPTAR